VKPYALRVLRSKMDAGFGENETFQQKFKSVPSGLSKNETF